MQSFTLRQWRRVREISQEDMARRLGIHVNTYRLWEEHPDKIKMAEALQCSEILGVPLDKIIFLPDNSIKS